MILQHFKADLKKYKSILNVLKFLNIKKMMQILKPDFATIEINFETSSLKVLFQGKNEENRLELFRKNSAIMADDMQVIESENKTYTISITFSDYLDALEQRLKDVFLEEYNSWIIEREKSVEVKYYFNCNHDFKIYVAINSNLEENREKYILHIRVYESNFIKDVPFYEIKVSENNIYIKHLYKVEEITNIQKEDFINCLFYIVANLMKLKNDEDVYEFMNSIKNLIDKIEKNELASIKKEKFVNENIELYIKRKIKDYLNPTYYVYHGFTFGILCREFGDVKQSYEYGYFSIELLDEDVFEPFYNYINKIEDLEESEEIYESMLDELFDEIALLEEELIKKTFINFFVNFSYQWRKFELHINENTISYSFDIDSIINSIADFIIREDLVEEFLESPGYFLKEKYVEEITEIVEEYTILDKDIDNIFIEIRNFIQNFIEDYVEALQNY